MNRVKNFLHTLLFAALLGACISPPDNFPSVPEISFESLSFNNTGETDSLKVKIRFKDAEGDLGLNATDINPPFHSFTFILDDNGEKIYYKDRPSQAPNYNPIDWELPTDKTIPVIEDTVWVERNPNHYNIFIKFFIKRNGVLNELKLDGPPFYSNFNGRFPRVLTGNQSKAVEGTIEYAMLTFSWESAFRTDTLRIDVQIQDRALNRSNIVSSPEVTLNQIRAN